MAAEVIIIGAGAAGLMAANELAARAHKVAVVEARPRAGGRIHTMKGKFGIPVETGAEFMHGRLPLTLSLVEKSKTDAVLLSGNRYQLWDGTLKQEDFLDREWDLLIASLKKLRTDTDIASFLNKYFPGNEYALLRKKVTGFVEGFDAADTKRVSAMALSEEWQESGDEQQYHITAGYSTLIRYLEIEAHRHTVDFLFSSPVEEIAWSPGKVRVLCSGGHTLEAEKVIITVPLGVLQNTSIRFTPPLPEHARAIQQMGFGGVIKFFFEFNRPFWEDQATSNLRDVSFIFSDAQIPTWWTQRPDKTPLLTGWLGGPAARRIHHDPENLFNTALHSLHYVLNCSGLQIEKEIREWHVSDWVTDPFAMGAYAYPAINSRKAVEFVSRPVRETIYFGGEAFYNGPAMGTVEAALVNGKEVAARIL